MIPPVERRSDCSRCAALCCIAFPAEDMPGFAATKAAGEPCPNLDTCGNCRIYESRLDQGFAGCIAFECFGAGQHVTQLLFRGQDWRKDRALLPAMTESFLAMRPISEMLFLAEEARTRIADARLTAELDGIESELLSISSSREALGRANESAALYERLRAVFREAA